MFTGPQRFGKYRLVARLGQGGMATVYLAVARAGVKNVKKLVVIKLLNENLATNEAAIAMFLREARLAAELSHPNVVSTYTVGQDDGRYYILMEYLEGVSLRQLMSYSAEWSLTDRYPLLGALCLALSGLKYVHEFHDYQGSNLNLVHRDVKPDNIFLTTTGQVKLLDFGVAKIRSAEYDATLGGEVIKGTVQYLAPEAVRTASEVDQRSDIFGAGVVLAELASGTRYWGDETYPAILTRLGRDDLPAIKSGDGEEFPAALRRICEAAMHPDREQRIQTAFELRKLIQGFLVRQGYVLDTADLAALVQEVYAPIHAERAEAIREATQAESESSDDLSVRSRSSTGVVTSVDFRASSSDSIAGVASASNPTEVTQMSSETNEGSNKRIAVIALLLLAVPAVWFAARSSRSDETALADKRTGAPTGAVAPGDSATQPASGGTPANPTNPAADAPPSGVDAAGGAEPVPNPETTPAPLPEPTPTTTPPTDAEDTIVVDDSTEDSTPPTNGTSRANAHNARRRRPTPTRTDKPESPPSDAAPPLPTPAPEPKATPAKPPEARTKIEANPYVR